MAGQIAERWILDYVCYDTWNEFKTSNFVGSNTKEIVQGIIYKTGNDERCMEKVYFLINLTRLSDGEDHDLQFIEDSYITVLEDSLSAFDNLLKCQKKTLREEGEKLIPLIKAEAVYVCCRDKAFDKAKEVFERIWTNSEHKQKHYKKSKAVLEKPSALKNLNKWSYPDFLLVMKSFLAKIAETFEVPIILKAVTYLLDTAKEAIPITSHLKSVTKNVCCAATEVIEKLSAESDAATSTPSKKKRKESEIFRQMLGVEEANDPGSNREPQSGNDKSFSFNVPASPVPHSFTYRKNIKRPNRHEPADLPDSTSPRKRRCPDTSSLASSIYGHSRKKWTDDEMVQFYIGVQKFGVGKWVDIRDYLCTTRSAVDLKDKWRNMVKKDDFDEIKRKIKHLKRKETQTNDEDSS